MAERGAKPNVSTVRRKALNAVGTFFTPLLPDDYLELINPLWSTQELRGRIERIHPEADGAATIVIRPGHKWQGHRPGQYLRVGVVVDGIHHWRAYSLTSNPGRPDGFISITPKLVDGGTVSPWFVKKAKPGEIVRLGGVEGTFVLPDPVPPNTLETMSKRHRLAHVRFNSVERVADGLAEATQRGNSRNGDQSGDEAVFDRGGSLVVLHELLDESHLPCPLQNMHVHMACKQGLVHSPF